MTDTMHFVFDGTLARILRYGESKCKDQHMIWVEELAELQKEISKMYRTEGLSNKSSIKEEIADTLICINQMLCVYDIPVKEIQWIIDAKEKRQLMRIELKEFSENKPVDSQYEITDSWYMNRFTEVK